MRALGYVYLLALAVWLGAMVGLGGLAAPAIFDVLQAREPVSGRLLAGAVFGEILRRLHWLAYASAILLGVCLAGMAALGARPRALTLRLAIISIMLALTLYSGIVVSGRIERLQREIGGPPSALADTDPRRIRFGRLHALSTLLMTLNVAGGMVLLYWETEGAR